MKCVNENCKNDPMKSNDRVVATIDYDFACCEKCKKEYEKQRDQFFDNIGNDEWYNNWLNKE